MSDELVLDARLIAEMTERSIAGQIEFWAALGRAIEPLLRTPEILALGRAGKQKPLSECLKDVDAGAGRRRVANYLRTRPFPHYKQENGQLVRIDRDGRRTVGRFINRQFEPLRRAPKK
jgi:ParD-like antitoxin of type II bacterial toxin-antitoxin system